MGGLDKCLELFYTVVSKMANRAKTERNEKIIRLWDNGKGWRQKSIAKMFKMNEGAVQMVIARARKSADKSGNNGDGK